MKKFIVFLIIVMTFSMGGLLYAGQFGASEPIANPGKSFLSVLGIFIQKTNLNPLIWI